MKRNLTNRFMINKKFHPACILYLLVIILSTGSSWWLLGSDFFSFIVWWGVTWLLGFVFMPVTSKIFTGFHDKGWMFSKVIGIAVCGYITWLFSVLRLISFNALSCMLITLICAGGNVFLLYQFRNKEIGLFGNQKAIFIEEVLFFILFSIWSYAAGFHPAAHGTEKFMDFGFMQSMMKSTVLPAEDMWYAGSPFNYYYGGQYFAVFLTKLTGTDSAVTYNLMRTFIAAFAFVLPFCLVRQMLYDRMKTESKKHPDLIAGMGGFLAGGAVSISGNMHYIIYSKLIPIIHHSKNNASESSYWFPDSTRYIGHDISSGDETIHEFPSYSFVLGDLHAHVINIFFVLTVIGILYAWLQKTKDNNRHQTTMITLGLFLGVFQFSNTWDFVIYFVVICGTIFLGNLKQNYGDIMRGFQQSIIQWLEVFSVSVITALPFNLNFNSSMVQGIEFTKKHSPFYQFCVLWALPLLVCGIFFIQYLYRMKKNGVRRFMDTLQPSDMYVLILSLCAIGLICIPEIVYVKDIYEKNAPRANTMFKLTYQAYILFGIAMAYILVRYITHYKSKIQFTYGLLMTCLLLSTFGYLGNAVKNWFYGFPDKENYQKLNAVSYLQKELPSDASAIYWLNDNIKNRPVILEANGESYKDYNNRVSAMTGLPTVLGWYVHEWLWRNDLEELNERVADITTIYTSDDKSKVKELLNKYDVSYIFIGSCEYTKYESLNLDLLKSLGDVVFESQAESNLSEGENSADENALQSTRSIIIQVNQAQ